MEGLDQNWNYIERNEVIYSHLPAGEYTFYIKACNSDGIWGDATGIDVVVHPPVWLTGWAKVNLCASGTDAGGRRAVLFLQAEIG